MNQLIFDRKFSNIDKSINYVGEFDSSLIETRFVSRDDNQMIIYVSSQNGCNMACRFCHLTQTRQTTMVDVTPELYGQQVETVLRENIGQFQCMKMKLNINFMSRGEALQNQYVLNNWNEIEDIIFKITDKFYIKRENIKFNISTIIPKQINKTAAEIFGNSKNVWLYWSLYSFDEKFKKRWMPNAINVEDGIKFFDGWEQSVLHMCFIKGENDSIENLYQIYSRFPAATKMNIVRYNPYSEKQGEESDRLNEIYQFFKGKFDIQIIDRVGLDVAASCGMFLT